MSDRKRYEKVDEATKLNPLLPTVFHMVVFIDIARGHDTHKALSNILINVYENSEGPQFEYRFRYHNDFGHDKKNFYQMERKKGSKSDPNNKTITIDVLKESARELAKQTKEEYPECDVDIIEWDGVTELEMAEDLSKKSWANVQRFDSLEDIDKFGKRDNN